MPRTVGHGRPAGVLIGFATEDDWLDCRLENDLRFLERIARASLHAGKGVPGRKSCRRRTVSR
jgi:hypothetical protein